MIYLFTDPFIYLFIYSFIYLYIYLFIYFTGRWKWTAGLPRGPRDWRERQANLSGAQRDPSDHQAEMAHQVSGLHSTRFWLIRLDLTLGPPPPKKKKKKRVDVSKRVKPGQRYNILCKFRLQDLSKLTLFGYMGPLLRNRQWVLQPLYFHSQT